MRLDLKGIHPLELPLLIAQGLWVRLRTPRLPEAAGEREGVVEGDGRLYDLIVIGESPVAGIGAPDHERALAGQIAKSLNQRGGATVRWTALGKSGGTARSVRLELVPELAGRTADGVVVVLGVNDAIDFNPEDAWKRDIEDLIRDIRAELGMVRIVLAGAPPLDRFPAFPGHLRRVLGRRSARLDCRLAEVAQALPDVIHRPMVEGMSYEHFCEDRFHPGVKGYALWGDHLSRPLLAGDERS